MTTSTPIDPVNDCICPVNVPQCPKCGRKWDFRSDWSDGTATYTSLFVVERYRALYGAFPSGQFIQNKAP